MSFEWGYSPKVEKYIPLGDFPADRYLIIAQQAIENLGWKLSHLSASGIIAYTGLSVQSYSEEISIRIVANFAIFKSECIGIQLLFTDYGKNQQNLDKFFHEFEYVEYHLKDVWEQRLLSFQEHITKHDDSYFKLAPLRAKDRIRNVFYLFLPQKDYLVTPIIVNLNILLWLAKFVVILGMSHAFRSQLGDQGLLTPERLMKINYYFGLNSREFTLGGQWWRLLTHQFFHFSLSHLFFNLYALVYIGLMIENKLGSLKTLAVYILSGICGGLVSVYTHEIGFMGGASGAIMGMFGAFLALLLSNAFEKTANKALLISTLILVVYMLLSGLLNEMTDNSAHFGGLVSGFVIGYLLYNQQILSSPVPAYYRTTAVGLLVIGFGALIFKFSPRYQVLEYAKLRYDFNVNDTKFNQIYYISSDLEPEEKLRRVKEFGVEVWKENLKITKEMDKLVLLEIDELDRKYRKVIAQKAYEASVLMYQDYEAGTRENRRDIQQKIDEVSRLKAKLREALEEGR
jgi:rhomboid protease GluP